MLTRSSLGSALTWPVSLVVVMCFLLNTPVGSIDMIHHVYQINCSDLRMGQFKCNLSGIDSETQQPEGCTKQNIAKISCELAPGLICEQTGLSSFEMEIPCKHTNGYSYTTSLLLSVFLGFLGADRFYLGHIGMGALKFCTLGFLFVGHIVDIILIATQNILPKDGSNFVVGYYGPAVETIRANNYSYVVPRPDWYAPSV